MADKSFKVEAVLKATDAGYFATMQKAGSAVEDLTQKAGKAGSNIFGSLEKVGKGMTIAGAATTAMGVKAVKGFGNFEASLNKAAIVAGGTSKDIEGLADVANRMGKDLPLSAQDAADAMIVMAQNGASLETIKKIFPAIAQAATASGADLVTTAGVVQQAMNVWGDSIGSAEQAAAVLTQTANVSNASVESMEQALSNVASSSRLMGVDMKDASTAIGLITNTGMSAAQASQDLNHAMLKMAAPSKKASKLMNSLGLSYTDAAGNMKPFKQILIEVNDKIKDMSQSEKAATLKTLFDTSGMQAISPLLDSISNKTKDATKSWDAARGSLEEVSRSQGDAAAWLARQAEDMQNNVGSKLEQVGGSWEALRNKVMASNKGMLTGLLSGTSKTIEWATESDNAVAKVIRGFVGMSPVIGPAMTTIGTTMMQTKNIMSGLGSILQCHKGVYDLWMGFNYCRGCATD